MTIRRALSRLAWPALLVSLLGVAPQAAAGPAAAGAAKQAWRDGEYGGMLARILPPSITPGQLPQPGSPGAALLLRYCVQCHNLPNPAMHAAEKWPGIVARMATRMQGNGNMGILMKDLMAGVSAPDEGEAAALTAYLRRNSQRSFDRARYPDIDEPAAQSFKLACSQCHTLPDPRRHRARDWPRVVARMQKNMAWMNRVVGSKPDPAEPQLRVDEIVAYLQRHSR